MKARFWKWISGLAGYFENWSYWKYNYVIAKEIAKKPKEEK